MALDCVSGSPEWGDGDAGLIGPGVRPLGPHMARPSSVGLVHGSSVQEVCHLRRTRCLVRDGRKDFV
ncbi:hypothetical protein LIP_0354 [Limnochorda pilosa]|uniref:Uncharacterized protein n=1 Tax=Limnochorda pilosa TaxID=1555112 RepID=A0A0K2SGI1_LIMPI|nr:hypothetical protein LIP_0354 [Limnochorda pilosa]